MNNTNKPPSEPVHKGRSFFQSKLFENVTQMFKDAAHLVAFKEDMVNEKCKEGCLKIHLTTLALFEDLDVKIKRSKTITKAVLNKKEDAKMKNVGKHYIYFILNMTLEEFHKTYVNFYKQFDKDNSLAMEESEFVNMIDFLVKPENLGYTKLTKCFEKVAASEYKKRQQIDLLFESIENNQIGPNVIRGMFDLLKYKDPAETGGNRDPCIDYLKILPLLLTFFSEHLRNKINIRKDNLEIIRGLDDNGELLQGTHVSLLTKLQGLGVKYVKDIKKAPKANFRVIEKALILFRNAYTSTFGNQQLNIILDELRIKMNVDSKTNKEQKDKSLSMKLLTWIAYRICLHSSLYAISQVPSNANKHKLNEEYSYWSAAVYAEKIEHLTLKNAFLKHAPKIMKKFNINGETRRDFKYSEMDIIFKTFIRKYIPHISSESLTKIFDKFKEKNPTCKLCNIDDFANDIFNLLVEEAQRKLAEYIDKVYEKLDPDHKYKKNTEEDNEFTAAFPKPAPNILDNNNLNNSQDSGSSEESASHSSQNFNPNVNKSQMSNREDLNNDSRNITQMNKSGIPGSMMNSDQEGMNSSLNKPKREEKNLLNSLFIMETFIEKIVYQKGRDAFIARPTGEKDLNESDDGYYQEQKRKHEIEIERSYLQKMQAKNEPRDITPPKYGSRNISLIKSEVMTPANMSAINQVSRKPSIINGDISNFGPTPTNNARRTNHEPALRPSFLGSNSMKFPTQENLKTRNEKSRTKSRPRRKDLNIEDGDEQKKTDRSVSKKKPRSKKGNVTPVRMSKTPIREKITLETQKSATPFDKQQEVEEAETSCDNRELLITSFLEEKQNACINLQTVYTKNSSPRKQKSVNTTQMTPFVRTTTIGAENNLLNKQSYDNVNEDQLQFKKKDKQIVGKDGCIIW